MTKRFVHVRVFDPSDEYWLKFHPVYMIDEKTGKKRMVDARRARNNDKTADYIYTLDVGSKGGLEYKLGWVATKRMLKKYKVGDVLEFRDTVPQAVQIELDRLGLTGNEEPGKIIDVIYKSKYMKYIIRYVSSKTRKHGVNADESSFSIVPKQGGDFQLVFRAK